MAAEPSALALQAKLMTRLCTLLLDSILKLHRIMVASRVAYTHDPKMMPHQPHSLLERQ